MLPVIVALLVIGLVLAALAWQRRWARMRRLASGLLISHLTIVLMLALGEVYFRFFHADTEGRLASYNWIERYWRENSLGFRDREWTPGDWEGKTTVAVLGDSFAAGWGIQNPADRFTDVLAQKLGADYAVFNLGRPGATTRQELETLRSHPVNSPDVVILQYFLNDIEDAALSLGLGIPIPELPPLPAESYLANYLYARTNSGFGQGYWEWEYTAYDNATIWEVHRQEIEALIAYVERIDARLIVVIFPNMQDPFRSIAYVDRVAMVFEEHGHHDVLKLFDAVAAWEPSAAIVSPRDGHPSVAFHHYVGETLYTRFFAPE